MTAAELDKALRALVDRIADQDHTPRADGLLCMCGCAWPCVTAEAEVALRRLIEDGCRLRIALADIARLGGNGVLGTTARDALAVHDRALDGGTDGD